MKIQLTPWFADKDRAEEEEAEAQELFAEVAGLPVQTPADLEFAVESLKEIKGKIKALEEMRTRATKPMSDALEEVRSWFRGPIGFYQKVETALKERIVEAYKQSQEQQRQALAEAAEASMAGNHDEATAAIERAGAQELPTVKGVSIRHTWDFEVTDISQIPRCYFGLDMVMIRAEIRAHDGNVNIPGIKVIRRASVAATAK